LFRFSILHPADIAICVLAGMISILWFEVLKMVNRRGAGSIKKRPV
jgi:Ca2+-transporting ATPase